MALIAGTRLPFSKLPTPSNTYTRHRRAHLSRGHVATMNAVMMKASRLGPSSWGCATINKVLFSAATAAAQQQQEERQQHLGDASRLRMAVPPRAAWKVAAASASAAAAAASADGVAKVAQEQDLHRVVAPAVAQAPNIKYVSPQVAAAATTTSKLHHHDMDVMMQQVPQQQVGPAPPGDLRLIDFMEQVKLELWQYADMPLRKRFRVQSLLRYYADNIMRITCGTKDEYQILSIPPYHGMYGVYRSMHFVRIILSV